MHQLQPVAFLGIPSDIPQMSPEVIKDLSTDQRYLYEICQSVSTGTVPQELSMRSPGALHHAQRLIRVNRILRLHKSTTNPTEKSTDLVMFLHAQGWFQIKSHPSVSDGAPNFWFILSCSWKLKTQRQEIVVTTLNKNSFFAHPDNVLIAMLANEQQTIRKRALALISHSIGPKKERNFVLPKIYHSAEHYFDLSHFEGETATPPLLGKIETLSKVEQTSLRFDDIPYHNQAVERTVAAVIKPLSKNWISEQTSNHVLLLRVGAMSHREVASL